MSSESGQPSERAPKDSVRIVYHAQNRTFARLFNERTLDEVKDVVRRKLGLGHDTDVSLKQIGPDALLDLEDDDDFHAFRALLRSCVSADIQVTVGRSQGPLVASPSSRLEDGVSAQQQPLLTSTEPPVASSSSRPKERARATKKTAGQSSAKPAKTTKSKPSTSTAAPASSLRSKEPVRSAAAADQSAEAATAGANPRFTPLSGEDFAEFMMPLPGDEPSAAEPSVTVSLPFGEPTRAAADQSTELNTVIDGVDYRGVESHAFIEWLDRAPWNSGEEPSVAESPVTASLLPSKELTGATTIAGQSTKSSRTAKRSTATKDPLARKRKVPHGDTGLTAPLDAPRAQSSTISPVLSAKTPAPKPVVPEEPPKKRQKKDAVKAKDIQPAKGVEDSSVKASSTPKSRVKKSAALDHKSEAGTSAPKDAKASTTPAKKPTTPRATGALKTRQSETKIGVCATIPRTSASATVQSEVAAAILSKASTIVVPAPPPKRKYVRKDPKKSSASSSALLASSTPVAHIANGVPNVPTEQDPEPAVPTNEPPPQTLGSNGPPCPICLDEFFHIRYCCPIVLKGSDAIRERLEEVKRTNTGDQESLIAELEGLLRDLKVTPKPSLRDTQSREASHPFDASVSRTPNIPSNSNLSEVTVENRGEGSSSESSDDMPEERNEHDKGSPAPVRQKTPDEQPLPSNGGLETVIRGPSLKKWQSVLSVLDRLVCDDDDDGEDDGEDQAELEEDLDQEVDRSRHRLSKHMRSSDSGSEEEESKSPSPSRSVSGVQGSNNPVEKSIEHRDEDVVMRDGADPAVRGGRDGDSSEETHVGSEGRMVVDDPIRKNGTVIKKRIASYAPRTAVLQPSDVSNNEPQEFGQTDTDPATNQVGGALVASTIPNEADLIEPADDLEPPTKSHSSNADPIEAPPEDTGSFFAGTTRLTPNPGVTKRVKNRHGQILDDEAERPVLLEQLTSETTEKVTPLPIKGKSRKKAGETSTSQEPVSTRKSPRFSSLPPSTSTPAAVALLNHRVKSSKAAKTPAKRSELRTDAPRSGGAKGDNARNGAQIATTPSLLQWEILPEPPSSPFLQLDEPSAYIDELTPSSPQPDDDPARGSLRVRSRRNPEAEDSQGKERLFDLSPSQIPFPYSQHKSYVAPTNGKEREEDVVSESEEEATLKKRKRAAKTPSAQYRPLSELASQTRLFSPSLPTPARKSVTYGKTRKHITDKVSSSSSSDEDEDDAKGSEHIPRGRRAGSALTRKKKSLRLRLD